MKNCKVRAIRGEGRRRWRRGAKPSPGKRRNVREEDKVKLLGSGNKSLTQSDLNGSEEKEISPKWEI